MIGGPPKKFSFELPLSSADLWWKDAVKICIFVKKWQKKILSIILKCTKNSISGAINSLKCKNFGQFHFFIVFIQIKTR